MIRKTCPERLNLNRTRRLAMVAFAALLLPAAAATALLPDLGDPLGGVSTSNHVATPAGSIGASASGGQLCTDANLAPGGLTNAAGAVTGVAGIGAIGGVAGTVTGATGALPLVGGLGGTATGATQQLGQVSIASHTCIEAPVPSVPELAATGDDAGTGSGRGALSSAVHNGADAIGSAIKSLWDGVAGLF